MIPADREIERVVREEIGCMILNFANSRVLVAEVVDSEFPDLGDEEHRTTVDMVSECLVHYYNQFGSPQPFIP